MAIQLSTRSDACQLLPLARGSAVLPVTTTPTGVKNNTALALLNQRPEVFYLAPVYFQR